MAALERRPRPTEVRLKSADKRLEIDFDSGENFAYPAEFLRVESPSAEVKGHGPDQRVTVAGRRHVGIMRLEPVGNYAVRIFFDDLHEKACTAVRTGVSFSLIGKLAAGQELWQDRF